MKAKDSNLHIIHWEYNKQDFPFSFSTVDISATFLTDKEDIETRGITITWKCRSTFDGKDTLIYTADDSYKIKNYHSINIEGIKSIIAESYLRLKKEFDLRTNLLFEICFPLKISDELIFGWIEKLLS